MVNKHLLYNELIVTNVIRQQSSDGTSFYSFPGVTERLHSLLRFEKIPLLPSNCCIYYCIRKLFWPNLHSHVFIFLSVFYWFVTNQRKLTSQRARLVLLYIKKRAEEYLLFLCLQDNAILKINKVFNTAIKTSLVKSLLFLHFKTNSVLFDIHVTSTVFS